ncbi:conjugal transfer protein TraM [Legionella pneumophila]|uniref:conjugal transfer protein TraM n=1 Tax=Legionella pneumophila TaxID=446 RepID=UPI001A19AAE0|nr:conjugal transfer protein TraM [Legionella pneumophila]HAT8863241.1 conjugal transfer protein TraM [Legionella pneumophila subsp. pneumophila]MCZ4689311.1 conjugal transfer protein TraM [Legionella pneumophila]MDW9185308.1 conjugal transfer protein TraM [Legionella pneumophila]HAT2053634.1 conjugal transfer protein TraM [Legionella pneumophila]HAT8892817.1 conjugal transfer protein TraM [Legionella pneumophila subsp. pneumophila]
MYDKFDGAIQEIAIKHGVVLSKDDPILILQTMNNRLIEDTQKAQEAMLVQFREEIENISSQWKDDAKQKAEKVLNYALAGSKELMAKLIQQSASESAHVIKKMLCDSLNEARYLAQQNRKFSRMTLLASAIIVISICLILLFSLTRV